VCLGYSRGVLRQHNNSSGGSGERERQVGPKVLCNIAGLNMYEMEARIWGRYHTQTDYVADSADRQTVRNIDKLTS
jgi:Tfp pilus assembly protein PilX